MSKDTKEIKMLFHMVDEETLETVVAIPVHVAKNPLEARMWSKVNVEPADEVIEICLLYTSPSPRDS